MSVYILWPGIRLKDTWTLDVQRVWVFFLKASTGGVGQRKEMSVISSGPEGKEKVE
jgi:hypothetical protein